MTDAYESRFVELAALAEAFASAQATVDHLSEFRKSKKALLMRDAEARGFNTAAMQEREAYAHAEYVALLDGLKQATEQALAAKWKLEIARMRFGYWRTK